MKFTSLGGARQNGSVAVKNESATVTIPRGAPTFYKHDTAKIAGQSIISAEGLSAVNQKFFAGIAMQEIAPGQFGDAFCYGFYDEVRVFQRSRTASGVDWTTAAAIAVGDILAALTASGTVGSLGTYLNQAFSRIGADLVATGASSATDATAQVTLNDLLIGYIIRAAETFSSTATLASSDDTSPFSGQLVSYVNLRCLIRAL